MTKQLRIVWPRKARYVPHAEGSRRLRELRAVIFGSGLL